MTFLFDTGIANLMQCLNCGFENMPGLSRCGRCESPLTIEAFSVEPQRASVLRIGTRIEQFLHLGRRLIRVPLNFKWPRWVPRSYAPHLWPTLARTFVPGLGHLRIGNRVAGWAFLIVWSLFVFGGLISFPSNSTVWFFSGAIATHAAAVVSVFAEDLSYQNLAMRGLFGILLFISLRQLVYVPIDLLFEQFWIPFAVPERFTEGPTLMAGDGVLFEGPWLRPGKYVRGDLVLYSIAGMSGREYYSREGYGIDRIVGVPGDQVAVRNGRLLVNGETPPADLSPLGPATTVPDIFFRLGSTQYAILPMRIPIAHASASVRQQFFQAVSTVDVTAIRGRIRWRLQPWSRLGKVH